MRSSKVLEMLEKDRIEELKALLQDEIFVESLNSKPDAKKRYGYMKRYLTTVSGAREILKDPCEVEFEGIKYNAFCNTYSLALTVESCGELKMCSEPDRYPPVERLLRNDGAARIIDINRVLAEAKSKGYKFTKNAIYNNDYLLKYDGAYFRMALLDVTYGIINDGKKAIVHHVSGTRQSMRISTDIGLAVVMPVFIEGEPDGVVVEAYDI